jgi:hypothetical protein
MKQFYRVIRKADNKPMTLDGKEFHYTRGEAIKKARQFDGKIQPLSEEENDRELLREVLENLKFSFCEVLAYCDAEKEFGSKYPFEKNFREIVDDVIVWVNDENGEAE